MTPRVALVTHSTRPRGGMVHSLALAEALVALGSDVTIVTLGEALHRPTTAPHLVFPKPEAAGSLEERVDRAVDALAAALADLAPRFDLFHAQDCIAARAAARVRDSGTGIPVLRTVHHVDDFTTAKLVDCQRQAILEPDRVLVVSRHWQGLLRDGYGVNADVIHNGVDAARFAIPPDPEVTAALRARIGAGDRFVFLAVGGIEPRKGSAHLLAALGRMEEPRPVLAVVGGHSFQDYTAYRDAALASLPGLGLEVGRDVILVGTVDDAELRAWYHAADALAFPSLKEGWGLAVLEAMAAGLPVIATDIPVFREYLTPDLDALLVPPGEPAPLAAAMAALMVDADLRRRLSDAGRVVAARFTWEDAAHRHLAVYRAAAGPIS
ncbi:MAG TPA: MSMEG_0565 family glycosyltransferase [Acidimicrobiales bacterium]